MIDLAALRSGDRRMLGKAITLLESTRPDHRQLAEELLQKLMPETGHSIRVGITGSPGVGKSSFIEVFGTYIIEQGHRLAVLTVDPSSSLSGGSILGDKTRMETLAVNPFAFIRSAPAGSTLGGVARRTQEAILVCEAAGFDVVLVETLGVGQSETLVADMTDVFLLMLLPGAGDDLQGIKRGIMELADIVMVNKADGEMKSRAIRSAADITQSLQLIQKRLEQWDVPVEVISVLENVGIDTIWSRVCQYQELLKDGPLKARRALQFRKWFWSEVKERLIEELETDDLLKHQTQVIEKKVGEGDLLCSIAARELVSSFINRQHSGKKYDR